MLSHLTNHIWQSTLFAIAAALLTLAFRNHRASVRFWLWFSASLKFLVPFALLAGMGANFGWAPAARRLATQIAPAAMPIILPQQTVLDTLLLPPSAPAYADWITPASLGVWALGFCGITFIRLRGWRRISTAIRASAPSAIPAIVEIRSCPGLIEPGVVGVFRPVLLVPAGIADRLAPGQLDAVLAHELCHVRRRDNLFATIHMLVEAIFWFHPLVWWIGRKLVEERERACDEEVLAMGGEPRVYAEGIVNICKLYAESPLACVSGVTGSNITKRIEAIMTNRHLRHLNFAGKSLLAAAAVVALAVPISIGILRVPQVRAQSLSPMKFDSVSIQPGCAAAGGEDRKGKTSAKKSGPPAAPAPGSLSQNCATIASLIHSAYGTFASGQPLPPGSPHRYLDAVRMSAGPPWIYTDKYQIHAEAAGDSTLEMMRGPMMQRLLEDRFKLKIRRETREVPGYALSVDSSGAKLTPYTGDCVPDFVLEPLKPGQQHCWEIGADQEDKFKFTPHFGLDSHVQDLDSLAVWLYVMTDRPVSNRTGLSGKFFMNLEFAPDQTTPNALYRLGLMASRTGSAIPAPSDPPGPSLTTALQQQLGLKLEPATGSRDFLIVENAEKP